MAATMARHAPLREVPFESNGAFRSSSAHTEELRLLLRRQHEEVLRRMDQQDAVLLRLASGHGNSVQSSRPPSPGRQHVCSFCEGVETKSHDTLRFSPRSRRPSRLNSRASFETNRSLSVHTVNTHKMRRKNSTGALPDIVITSELRLSIRRLTTSAKFDIGIGVLIILNAIVIGMDVEHQAANFSLSSAPLFKSSFHLCSALFGLELLLRIIAQGGTFLSCENPLLKWNIFDSFLVLVSIIEVPLDNSPLHSIHFVRVIRITRFVQLMRVARFIKIFRSLRLLINSITSTSKALGWAVMLLLLIIYCFGVVFTQTAVEYIVEQDGEGHEDMAVMRKHWGTLPRSMLTLFACICNGIDWDLVARPLGRINGFWLLLFAMYISFSYFAVLNSMTGVFCQTSIESSQRDRELVVRSLLESKAVNLDHIRSQLHHVFITLDKNGKGCVSMEEFELHLQDDQVSGFFALLDIDTSDAYTLFQLLHEETGGSLDAEEFVKHCLRFKGPARTIDLAMMRSESKRASNWLATLLLAAHEDIRAIAKVVLPPPSGEVGTGNNGPREAPFGAAPE